MSRDSLLVVAGEASGDLHGARLLSELRRLWPEVEAFGLGGDELQEAGLDAVAHSREISVVGITEAIRILPRARRIFRRLLEEAARRETSGAVLIDSPDFNLRLARRLEEAGVKVVYYVSPQVWAWRRGRVRAIARLVDRMLVLFPFEVDFYRRHGVDVTHVGHPLVDEVPELPQAWDDAPVPGERLRVALLPGSRVSEVRRLLPVLLEAGRRLQRELPVDLVLVRAATVPREALEGELQRSGLAVDVVERRERLGAIAACHLALCASGTATLEVGLLRTPMIVVYRVGWWSSLVGKLVLRLPHVSLVNLVLEREAVPELLQRRATPARIAATARELLTDRERVEGMRRSLGELRSCLGEAGASRRAAAAAVEVLREETA